MITIRLRCARMLPIGTLDESRSRTHSRVRKIEGAVCLKTTSAYERTLDSKGTRERGESPWRRVPNFRPRTRRPPGLHHVHLVASARSSIPVPNPHRTRIQGSNPMLLVDPIAANPTTKLILFHGGYP
jgi:hypothetical protein